MKRRRLLGLFLVGAMAGCGDCPEIDAPPLEGCFGEEPDSPACRFALQTELGPIASGATGFRCEGIDRPDAGTCGGTVPPVFIFEADVGHTVVVGDVLAGPDQWYLTILEGPDGLLLSRLCRGWGSDDDDAGGCSTCARTGTVMVSELPDRENADAFHAEIHAEFPGGGSVDAVF